MSTLVPLAPAPFAVNPALLDGAVAFINRAARTSGLDLARAVSEYVVATFFGGDFSAVSSKDPHKSESFAALCAREDLQMGAATLHRLVRIGQQARHLPAELAESLSLSHHRLLLTVNDLQHKQKLARLAVRQAWTVEQLQSCIAAEKPAAPIPLGRPAKPAPLKWLGAVNKAVGQGQDTAAWTAEVALLPPAAQGKLKADLLALQAAIGERLAALP
jgi:hypothetical protein